MSKIGTRLCKLERQLSEVRLARCPLCLEGGVWRVRIVGEPQLVKDDPVYDETWHCKRCGRAAPEIRFLVPGLPSPASPIRGDLR